MKEKWRKILTIVFESDELQIAIALNNVAKLYQQKGNYEKALSFYQQTLEINEKIMGPEHPRCCNNPEQSRSTL